MFKQLPGDSVETVDIVLNEQVVSVTKGMTVAAVALSHNVSFTRTTAVSGVKRAPFCMMGVCYECLMVIDGQPNQRACATLVEEGMHIKTQSGAGTIAGEAQHG